jgi:hypothetical protein
MKESAVLTDNTITLQYNILEQKPQKYELKARENKYLKKSNIQINSNRISEGLLYLFGINKVDCWCTPL